MRSMEKYSCESETIDTKLILPRDTNPHGNLYGGTLMDWIDMVAAIVAMRHSNSLAVTASVDSVDFKYPVKQGDVLSMIGKITWTGRTSMEVEVRMCVEDLKTGKKKETNRAYLVLVAVGENNKPVEVPQLIVEDAIEWEKAKKRREIRLARGV